MCYILNEGESDKERRDLLNVGSLSKWLHQQRLGQAEARNSIYVPMGGRDPSIFPRTLVEDGLEAG